MTKHTALRWAVAAGLAACSVAFLRETVEMHVIEAENFAELILPFERFETPDASEGAALVLPLGAGQGWRGEDHGSGAASYRLDVARPGLYRLWGRTLWQDGCTNAVFVTANDGPRLILGNDAVFGQWHWVRGPMLELRRGLNVVTFSNHSDGIALDKFIFTSDPYYTPQGFGEGMTRFYDGFAGCDGNNMGSWTPVQGRWSVVQAANMEAAGADDCLAQWDPGGGRTETGAPAWRNYTVAVSAMLSQPGQAGIAFFVQEDAEWRLLLDIGNARALLRLEEHAAGGIVREWQADAGPARLDAWSTLGVVKEGDSLAVELNGKRHLTAPWPAASRNSGLLALIAQKGGTYFDNVDVSFLD
jgi:hypothetical protein